MNEVDRNIEAIEAELADAKIKNLQMQNQFGQSSVFPPQQDKNIVEFQLSLDRTIDKIFHLLSSHELKRSEEGNEIWVEPKDDRMKVFSQYGVSRIMNIISFYLTKDNLLSSYDETRIITVMRDLGIELSDLIYNDYEAFFYYQTPEKLYELYLPIINEKQEINITEKELYWKCVEWSEVELKNKLKHYSIMIISILDIVESVYRRALHGEERRSLRRQTFVSENATQQQMPSYGAQQQFKLLKPGSWGK